VNSHDESVTGPGGEGGWRTPALDDLLVAVAAAGLPGSLREFPEAALPEQQALDLVHVAERLGLAGFMLLAVRSCGLCLPPIAIEALDEAQLRESTTRLYLEQELVSVCRLLDEAEIECRVLDGGAVGHLDYRDPEVRAVTRLDLLVHPRALGRAAEVLRRSGWRTPRDSTGRPERGVGLVGPSGPRLVLHDDIDGVPGLSVDVRQLWADGDPFTVGRRKLKALGSEQRLIHASTLALDADEARSLLPQRDLVEMALFGEWRRPRLMDLAFAWNAQGVLAEAVATAWRRLAIADVTGLSVWAEGQQADARRSAGRHNGSAGPDPRARGRSWGSLRTGLARWS
jgi:hypothetical protein